MELGSQIKNYRTNMDLSQEELAEKIYVTRQTISNWENNKAELQHFNHDSAIFSLLLALLIVSFVPLAVFLNYYGLIILAVISAASIYYAIRLEKFKKKYDIQTYQEIVAFMDGKKLDEIEKARESGKRPYQKFLALIISGVITFIIGMLFMWLLL